MLDVLDVLVVGVGGGGRFKWDSFDGWCDFEYIGWKKKEPLVPMAISRKSRSCLGRGAFFIVCLGNFAHWISKLKTLDGRVVLPLVPKLALDRGAFFMPKSPTS